MMKRIRYIWLLMIVMMLTSCELFNFEELSTESPNKVLLSKNIVDIHVGDSVFFQAKTDPADLLVNYAWSLEGDTSVYDWKGYWFYATKPGRAEVVVEATSAGGEADSIMAMRDSCEVNVFEWIDYEYENDFLYETVVYSSLSIDGEEIVDTLNNLQVVAIVDDRVRCRAKMEKAFGVSYVVFRIGSFWPGEKASLQCYAPNLYRRMVLKEIILDGNTQGTLSNLVKLQGTTW